jgi:hypothetical protein
MKALHDLLREADPLTDDPGLSSAEARVIRRLVVDAASEREAATPFAHQPLAIAAVLTMPSPRSTAPETSDERRQLQFATPGGTRIIWTFDPEFHP